MISVEENPKDGYEWGGEHLFSHPSQRRSVQLVFTSLLTKADIYS
jgi:hypothetical protein